MPLKPSHSRRDSRVKMLKEAMNDTALKAFTALIPVCTLFTGSVIIWLRRKRMSSFFQFLGATGLLVVILTHVFEGLRLFPRMHWGSQTTLVIISICCAQFWVPRCFLSDT